MKLIIFLTCCIALTFGAPATKAIVEDKSDEVEIISEVSEFSEDGGYKFGFKSSDGVERLDTGSVVSVGKDEQAVEVSSVYRYKDPNGNLVSVAVEVKADGSIKGKYSYTDANGEPVEVSYTASKAGFVPFGNIIPKEISENAENATPED